MVLLYLPGGIPVYAYATSLALGAFVGLLWVARQAPQKEIVLRLDAGLWVLAGSLVGGRLVYALVNLSYFQLRPWEIFWVFLGGMAWPGALAGGCVALALYAWRLGQPVGKLADSMLPLLVALAASAWLGCWLDGCAYGWPTSLWGVLARDEWGVLAPRWPLQLFGASATIGLFWLLEQLAGRIQPGPGLRACLGVLGFSLLMFGLSFLRADISLAWLGIRLEAWAALCFSLLALVGALVFQIGVARSKEDRKQ